MREDFLNRPLDWNSYLENCSPYFKSCENSTVLEIGAFQGLHSDLILSKNPKSLTLLEPDYECYKNLLELYANECNIVNEDIFFYLEKERFFDTVVCCGVLYHFHNPFWLLELIVNRINPQNIILETFGPMNIVDVCDEEDNISGNRQVKNWKTCKISIRLPIDIIVKAMKNLGYTLIDRNMIKKPILLGNDWSSVHLMTFTK